MSPEYNYARIVDTGAAAEGRIVLKFKCIKFYCNNKTIVLISLFDLLNKLERRICRLRYWREQKRRYRARMRRRRIIGGGRLKAKRNKQVSGWVI